MNKNGNNYKIKYRKIVQRVQFTLIIILSIIKLNLEMISKPITVAVMNCQSIKNKKVAFSVFVDEHKLNIIIGSESGNLPQFIPVNCFLLIILSTGKIEQMAMQGYSFCAVRGCLVHENLPLTTTYEVVVCCIQSNSSSLVVCSVYRPPSSNCMHVHGAVTGRDNSKLPKSVSFKCRLEK